MADTCATCGAKLGFTRRLTGASECSDCAAKRKATRSAAEVEYRALLDDAAAGTFDLAVLTSTLPALAERAELKSQESRDLTWKALLSAFDRALADEIITRDEEDRLARLADSLGLGRGEFERAIEHYEAHVVSERLGHRDERITLTVYSHVIPVQRRDAADRLGALLYGAVWIVSVIESVCIDTENRRSALSRARNVSPAGDLAGDLPVLQTAP